MNVAVTKETVILIEQKTICLPKMSNHNSKKKSHRHQEHATLFDHHFNVVFGKHSEELNTHY